MALAKIKLFKKVNITIPESGDKYGIENLKAVTKFSAKTWKKVVKYKKDGKYSLVEKIGSISILKGAIQLGRRWEDIRNEFLDQSNEEQIEIVQTLVDEFGWSFEVAKEHYVETVNFMIFVFNYFNRDIKEADKEKALA